MKITAWGKTDTGRKRGHNEDSFLVDEEARLYAVADGMGGHQGGGTASKMVLDLLQRRVRASLQDLASAFEDTLPSDDPAPTPRGARSDETAPITPLALSRADTLSPFEEASTEPMMMVTVPPTIQVMSAAAAAASRSIFEAASASAELRGMGTTLTAMMYDAGRMHIIHAGDSRAYLFRDNRVRQLTEDHSWIWEQMKLGVITEEEAKESKYRHVITRSVGFEREVELDTFGIAVEAGDCFVLCSDGMSNYVADEELERVLAQSWYRRVPDLLIEIANERGGDDNITVIVVHVANHNTGDAVKHVATARAPTDPGGRATPRRTPSISSRFDVASSRITPATGIALPDGDTQPHEVAAPDAVQPDPSNLDVDPDDDTLPGDVSLHDATDEITEPKD